jgi:hypothetical protein
LSTRDRGWVRQDAPAMRGRLLALGLTAFRTGREVLPHVFGVDDVAAQQSVFALPSLFFALVIFAEPSLAHFQVAPRKSSFDLLKHVEEAANLRCAMFRRQFTAVFTRTLSSA